MAFTRAVSPVHIEYLRNMGVAASLSISILVEGSLWGLVACHHRTPRLPSFVIRTATELFGQMYSLKLERRLGRADTEMDRRGNRPRSSTTVYGSRSTLRERPALGSHVS
jgi:light-regulated signal transduction histidine kinase (bacteriophytochrome)